MTILDDPDSYNISRDGSAEGTARIGAPIQAKNFGFLLKLAQLRTYGHRNFTLTSSSGQKKCFESFNFSAIRNLFCPRVITNGLKLLKMIEDYPCKPELMISRKFRFFSQNCSKNFQIL